MELDFKAYRRSSLLGAIGAALMMVGDLSLSVIKASQSDSGLFMREAYLNGSYESWRLPLLLVTGLIGMALCSFAVRASYVQIRPQYRKTRLVILISGIIYLTSAGVIHFMIGSLADWTSTLAPLIGREEAAALVSSQYNRVMPPLYISYAGMILMILGSAWAVFAKKTILPRKMFIFHMLVWQIMLAGIPDIRQALGAEISTWDFVLSQSSGNASLMIWMIANAIWAQRHKAELEMK